MLELRAGAFNLYVLGVADELELARVGSVDLLIGLAGGGRFAGTARTLADLDANLALYLPVTDSIVVRELTPEVLLGAVADLLEGGVLDEVFLEVLEEIGLEEVGPS